MEAIKELLKQNYTSSNVSVERVDLGSQEANEFYELVEKGILNDDQEAIAHYVKHKTNAKVYYSRLKKKVYTELAIKFVTTKRKGATDTQIAYFEIYRDYFISFELLSRGKTRAFLKIAERTIDKAIKYELFEIVTSLCRKVVFQYSIFDINYNKLSRYKKIMLTHRSIRAAEEQIEDIYNELVYKISSTRRPSAKIVADFDQTLNKVTSIFMEFPTKQIGYFYYSIQTIYTELKDDIWSTLHYCQEALKYFEEHPKKPPVGYLFMFMHKQVNVQIRVKRFEEAKRNLIYALEIIPKYSSIWHTAKTYQAVLHLHAGEYEKTTVVIKSGLSNKKELSETMQEQWRILEAYAHLLSPDKKRFRLARFLNQVVIFEKDKRGHNTNLLILQILFLLKQKKYNAIIDKVEALKQYTYDHLHKDDTFRTNCFLKMLCLLPAGNFHPVNVTRRTAKYYERMTTLPVEQQRMDIDVEMVPYEVLWEVVLGMLEKN